MSKRGRPSTYTDQKAEEICARLADGEPLREICRDEHMPPWQTVYGWIDANEDFSKRIARAREIGREAIFEDTLHIADTPKEGIETEISDDGKTKEKRADMLGHRKLQIETRLKLLAKWDPKRYGDRVQQDVNFTKAPRDMSIEELQTAIDQASHAQPEN